MPVLKTDSDSIHYAESGRGDPVLLAHSGGYTSTQWRGVMDALQARFRLLAIDLQGCASTPPPPRGGGRGGGPSARAAGAGDPAPAMGRFVEYWNARPGMWASLAEEVRAELTARVPAMLHQCHALKYDDTKVGELSSIALPTALMEGEATIEPMRRLMAVVARHMPTAGRI